MKYLEPGVMEYWSSGASREDIQPSDITPALQHSEINKHLKTQTDYSFLDHTFVEIIYLNRHLQEFSVED